MSKAAEIILSQKAATITASGSIATWLATAWGWVDANMVKASAFAAFILTLVMIFAHICTQLRQNREHRVTMRKNELEIELLRRKIEDARND